MKKSNDFQNVNVRGSKKLRISNHIASLQAQQMLMRAQLKKYEEYLQKNYHDRELLNVSKSHPKYNYLIKLRNPEEIRIEKIIDQAKNLFISKQYCETIILLDSTTASSKNCQATILQHKIRALIILELFEISLVNIDNLLQIKPEVVYYIIKFFILYLMKQFYKAKQSLLEASKLNIEELAKFMNPLIPDYNMNQTHQVENENAQPKFFIQNVEQYITAILNFRQDRDDENFKILKMLNISVFNQESLNQKNYLDNFSTQAKQFCDIQIGKNLSNFIYIHQKAILLIKLRDYTGAEKLLQHNKNNNLENQQYVQTYAKFLYDQNALDESLQMWNHSLKIDPQNSYSHYFKGLTLFKQKNYEKALKSITKASQILPECVEFISCKAGVLLIIKQYEKAIQFYNKAISLSPKQNFYYYYKANCLQQIGKFEESLLNYDLAIEIYPWKADFYLQKGQALEQYGQLVKALEYYWKAIDLDSENEIYYLILARCLNLQNKQQEAKKILQKCLRSIPSSFRVFLELGALLLQQGNQKNAINSFEYSLKQSQNSSEISYEITKHLYIIKVYLIQQSNTLIQLLKKIKTTKIIQFQKVEYILKLLSKTHTANINNPQKALDYIEQNIHVKQNNPYYFSIKGYLLLQQNKINEALEFFDKTLKIYPYESEILTYSAECLQKLGRFNESLERCNRSIQIKPLASSYNQKGITLKEMKRREEALDNYNLAIKMNPKEPLFYYHKGLLLFETSHYNNALQQYEIALQLNPELYLCLIEKCRTLNKLKLKNQALKVFEKVSQMSHQPQYSIYLFNYGVLLQELNLFEEALQLLCQATNQNQNLPGIFKIIVQSLVETNKYDEALSFVKEFKNNNYQDYHSYKGIILINKKCYQKALNCFQKAILRDSSSYSLYYHKGIALLNLNNSQEALEAFEQSIIYNPEQFQSFNQIGVLLFKQKKYEDALKYFQDGLHRKPQSSTFYGNLAITLTKILQYENALKYIENAITLEPNNHKLINQKGLLLAQMGRRKEAIKFFQQNISQYPDNPIYYINRGYILAKYQEEQEIINFDQNENAVINYKFGTQLIDLEFNQQQEIQDQHFMSLINYNFGVALFKIKKYDEAIIKFDNALKLDATLVQSYLMKGEILRQMGLHEKALECFCIDLNHINNADDFKASYLYQKGLTLFYLNRYLEAIDQFDKSLSINIHQNGLSHNMKALSLMEIGDLDSALFFINQAINNNSQNSAIRFNKALILIKLENLQEALIALDDAIQIDMNNVNFYNNKGWVLEKLGNLESAKQNYYLALEKNPQSSIIYFNLANVLFKLKDYQESLHICDLAIQRNLKSAQIYSCKGQIFFIWSQMDEVKKNFENAFLEPSCSDNEYRQFAQILFQKNDLKNALKYIEIAISRNSENNDNFMVQAEIVNSIQRECQRNENHQ